MRPRRGDRFEHAHQITGSPKAGTARPVVMVITAVRPDDMIYYRPDDGGTRGLWWAPSATLPVRAWLPR